MVKYQKCGVTKYFYSEELFILQPSVVFIAFEGLSDRDKRAFVEYLTYRESGEGEPVLYVNWTAKDTGEVFRGRANRRVEGHAGKDINGQSMAAERQSGG